MRIAAGRHLPLAHSPSQQSQLSPQGKPSARQQRWPDVVLPQAWYCAHVVGVWPPSWQHAAKVWQVVRSFKQQSPPWQFWFGPQTSAHAPQLLGLVAVLTHVPAQQVWSVSQLVPQVPQSVPLVCVLTQVPAQQVSPVAQRLLQPPQLDSSVCVVTQVPAQHV